MLRVHIIFEHGIDLKPFSVSYIRDILPLTHPANALAFQVTQGVDYSPPGNLAPPDVVIVARAWKPAVTPQEAEQLVRRIRQHGAGLVYSIDDNLLDLEHIPLLERQAVIYFCRAADGILVSTPPLQERLRHLNPRIFVLPNAIDERLFVPAGQPPPSPKPSPVRREPPDRLTIGFMGTFTHDSDLMMALQPLRQVLRQHRHGLRFQIVGGIAHPGFLRLFDGLPVEIHHPAPVDAAYPSFISWMRSNVSWDIGLAPLENTVFTRCKSDIKYLDYSALGIPGIYSRVPAYARSVVHLETGWLVENTPAAWVEALEVLIADPPLRQRLAYQAQAYVLSQRSLQHRAHLWREAIYAIRELP